MKQKAKKIIKNAAYFGANITVDKSLDKKYEGKILFPEKLAEANRVLSKLKNPPTR